MIAGGADRRVRHPTSGELIQAICGLCLTALLFVAWAFTASRSLDRSDEGLYLNAISDPSRDPASILLFGYVYHPLWELVGHSIALLRWANMLLTILTGSALAWTALSEPALTRVLLPRAVRALVSVLLGGSTLILQVGQPNTPSYHTLALQGLFVSLAGVVLARYRTGRASWAGWLLVGAGGALCALGKPTSALALAGTLLLLILIDRGGWLRGIPVGILGSVVVVLALVGSAVLELPATLSHGLHTSTMLGGHPDLMRLDPFGVKAYLTSQIVPSTVLVFVVIVGVLLVDRGGVMPTLGGVVFLGLIAPAAGWWIFHSWQEMGSRQIDVSLAVRMMMLFAAFSALLAVADFAPTSRVGGRGAPWFLGVLAVSPFSFAFGTNGNLWAAMGRAALCWVLMTTILVLRLYPTASAVAAPALGALSLTLALTAMHMASPFGYASIWDSGEASAVDVDGAVVGLAPTDAALTRRNLATAREVGLAPGTAMLDLTGDSPGYQFQLGLKPVGQDWILGGYAGSAATARYVLTLDACAMRGAWVLTAPGTPRNIDPAVLDAVGLDLGRDFTQVGLLSRYAPDAGAAGIPMQLWKPRGSARVTGCVSEWVARKLW